MTGGEGDGEGVEDDDDGGGSVDDSDEGRVVGRFEGRVGKLKGRVEGRVEERVEDRLEGRVEGRVEGSEWCVHGSENEVGSSIVCLSSVISLSITSSYVPHRYPYVTVSLTPNCE